MSVRGVEIYSGDDLILGIHSGICQISHLLEISGVWYFAVKSNWLLHWNLEFGIWKQAELASEYLAQSCITSSRGVMHAIKSKGTYMRPTPLGITVGGFSGGG